MIDRYAAYEADLVDDEFQNTEEQESMAAYIIGEPDDLRDLIFGYEPDIADQLSRCMREIDRACTGDEIAKAAVIESVSRIQRILLDAVKDSL